jgi:hypothetical protein
MTYTLIHVRKDGDAFNITPLAESIRWGGEIRQAARKLEVNLAFGRDHYLPRQNIEIGSLLILKNGNKEIIRGVIFEAAKDSDGGYSIKAYDQLIYLLKNNGTYLFRNMRADEIIRKLCADFGIPAGTIPNTKEKLEKLLLRDMNIYDMCLIALTETTKRNGRKFFMRMQEGKLHVVEKGAQPLQWAIREGSNLISASYSENINETRNRVVIVGDKDQVLAKVEDRNLINQFGLLQELRREDNIKTGEAQIIAKNLLKELAKMSREASITCLGIDEVVVGTAIQVEEGLTGLKGTFYVDSDDHSLENGQHMMTLKLNWTDEVDAKEASES